MIEYILLVASDEQKVIIDEIYSKYGKSMIIYARHKLFERKDRNYYHDGLDVVHAAFLKVIKYGTIDIARDEKELLGYFYSTINNEVEKVISDINKIRKLDEEYGYVAVTDAEFLDTLCIKERYQTVKRAIDLLDERYASVLIMNIYNSPEQIAKFLHLPVKTIYTRIYRARKLLIEKINSLESVGMYRD
jgi:RNA polymerase sigma-70 factor (ECF subfamily)